MSIQNDQLELDSYTLEKRIRYICVVEKPTTVKQRNKKRKRIDLNRIKIADINVVEE
jgi:hypothetical protein